MYYKMIFYKPDVHVSSAPPPEEILASLTGPFGLWQICITLTSFFTRLVNELDKMTVKSSLPLRLKFTCINNTNTDPCHYPNGTSCENFEYFNSAVVTFAEQLNLVCDKKNIVIYTLICYRIGTTLGYLLTGACIDKYGLKLTVTVFITLQLLTGLMVTGVTNFMMLISFIILHGMFACCLVLAPYMAVCDAVGNKFRTLGLGIVTGSRTISILIFWRGYNIFKTSVQAIATVSILPLILLIPLLYYKDSPNYICFTKDYSKAEEILRVIADFNRCPLHPLVRLRPVSIFSTKSSQTVSFFDVWRPIQTRWPYLALLYLWVSMGYYNSTVWSSTFQDEIDYTFGLCAVTGCIAGIISCQKFKHKLVIGVFECMKNMLILSFHIMEIIFGKDHDSVTMNVLVLVSTFFMYASYTALCNVTPRMFPTGLRATSLGMCLSLFHFGDLSQRLIRFNTDAEKYITSTFLVLSPFLASFACYFLWNVHNRELPDYLYDCIRFKKYYKPTRYFTIYEDSSEHEIEVRMIDLTGSSRTSTPTGTLSNA